MGKCCFDDINKGQELQFKLSFICYLWLFIYSESCCLFALISHVVGPNMIKIPENMILFSQGIQYTGKFYFSSRLTQQQKTTRVEWIVKELKHA